MAIGSLRVFPEAVIQKVAKLSPRRWFKTSEDSFVRKRQGKVDGHENVHTLKMANGKEQKLAIVCADPKKKAVLLEGIQRCLDKNISLEGMGFGCSRKLDSRYRLGFPLPGNKKVAARYDPREPGIVIWHGSRWNPFSRNYSLLAFFNRILFPTWGKNVYSGSPSHVVIHEIGHHLHYGHLKKFEPQTLTPVEKSLVRKELGHPHFTRADGHEFVAEMFAGLMGGKEFSPELMALYHKFHGPVPPGGF